MNFCSKCGNKFEKENVFCSKCGFKLDVKNESILGLKTVKETSAKPSKIKGNSVDEIQQKEDNKTFKTHNILNYVITRKRNILIFILLTLVLKPILHYTFFEEISKVVSIEKIELGDADSYSDFNLKDSIGNLIRLNAYGKINLYRSYLDDIFRNASGNLTIAPDNHSENAKNFRKYGLFNRKGEPIYLVDDKFITYIPKKIGFNEYFKEKYNSKHYLFLISFALIGLIAFLFNDKIKAR